MADATLAAADDGTPLKGIAFLVAGITIFSLQDVIIKSLSDAYPAHQIVFVRGLVAMLPIVALIYYEGGPKLFRTGRPLAMGLRGLCGFVSYMTYYLALTALPLADAITLFYASPLFVTALSVPLLGERVGFYRWLAVGIGFVGVVVVMRPGGGTIDPAMLLAVAAALSYGTMVLMTRRLSKTEAGSTMSFHSMIVFLIASGLIGLTIGDGRLDSADHPSAQFLLRAWTWPTATDFALFCVCGLIAGAGFYLLSQAYRVAPASVVAPFEYSSLPWASLWGYVFWAELPGGQTLTGVVLVVGAGLFIVHREARRGRRLVRGRTLRPRI